MKDFLLNKKGVNDMKKYRSLYFLLFSLFIFIIGISLYSCSKNKETIHSVSETETHKIQAEREILYYTCGMHPSVRVSPEDYERGNKNCPICNMDLIPVYKEDTKEMEEREQGEQEIMATQIKISPRAQALAQVKTETITFQHLFKEISAVGQIEYDERNIANVAAWVPGRMDKLFINFTGVEVKKGDPLVSIYSPNLVTTQEEYLLALETLNKVKASSDEETVKGAESLVEASKKRLLLWGVKNEQIEELEKKGKAEIHMTIYAPIGGTVIHKNALEGKYVKEGENLYEIANLSNLWVLADIYEFEISWIKIGQRVEIISTAYPGDTFKGKILFIDPYLNPSTRSVKVRVDVRNPQLKLKPGMFVTMQIKSDLPGTMHHQPKKIFYTCSMHPEVITKEPGNCPICGMKLIKKEQPPTHMVLAVPKYAVIDTGMRKVVYVEKDKGIYEGKEIEIGPEAIAYVNGQKRKFYVLKGGLLEGMKVVTYANFLIDSQSQITGQAGAIYSGAIEAGEEKKTPPSQHIH